MRAIAAAAAGLIACAGPARTGPIGDERSASCPERALRGTVRDVDAGVGAAGATLVLIAEPDDRAEPDTTMTDSDGAFVFPKVTARGRLTVYYNDGTFVGDIPRCATQVSIDVSPKASGGDVVSITIR